MAKPIDETALVLNPKESAEFQKFIFELAFNQADLSANHRVWTGLTMKEQIVFASLIGLSGIKDAGTSRPNSGGKPVLTQKYWEPSKVGDTMVFNQSEINSLFKAYFDKIKSYGEIYDISGSDEEKFLVTTIGEAAKRAINRLIWYGDTAVAAATAGASGLIAAGNVQYFDSINGIWKKVFAEVAATKLKRFTITKNAGATFAAQALATDEALAIFEGVWGQADPRLKADSRKIMYVTNTIFENYRQSLQTKGTPYDITITTDGFSELKWNGVIIRNMETIWDLNQTYFAKTNANVASDNPHRVLLTVPDNIPVGTLNEGDFSNVEAFYDQIKRENYMAYGFTLDAQLLEGYMAVAAY